MPALPALSLAAWLRILTGLAFALVLAWALRLDHLRAHWRGVAEAFAGQAGKVVVALEQATGETQHWETAPGQIVALGDGNRQLKQSLEIQTRAIDDMAREAVRLRARAEELRRIADMAQAQRRAALARLNDLALNPGTRADCLQLLREADEALDLTRKAGA